jgi:hypothetical protein
MGVLFFGRGRGGGKEGGKEGGREEAEGNVLSFQR